MKTKRADEDTFAACWPPNSASEVSHERITFDRSASARPLHSSIITQDLPPHTHTTVQTARRTKGSKIIIIKGTCFAQEPLSGKQMQLVCLQGSGHANGGAEEEEEGGEKKNVEEEKYVCINLAWRE